MDLTTMTEQELFALIESAEKEIATRKTVAAVNKQVADVLKVARRDGVIATPDLGAPWVQPVDATTAYMAGDVVTHNGRMWVSTVDYNVWEPGVSGWHEKPTDGSVPEWVRPSGTHDSYQTGDHVMFEGTEYVSKIDNNTWSPIDYPDGWEAV